ncbi:MAG: response regulator transcription factor [Bacteroidales bacterium]|nr:response regulator transcription factor [Bacteroidales bacterium]
MAGTVKEMSIIKQVLLLKQQGETNRGIARKLFLHNILRKLGTKKTAQASGFSNQTL